MARIADRRVCRLEMVQVITWSWWWVLSPIWFIAAFWMFVLIIVSVFGWIYNSKN